MKYVIALLIIILVVLLSSQQLSKQRKDSKTPEIDTVICDIKEYYGEDSIVGDKHLILVEECDTIYKEK